MKPQSLIAISVCVGLAAAPLQGASAAARDTDKLLNLSWQDLIHHPDFAAKVPSDVKFYLDGQPVTVKQVIGPVRTSRKSNKKSNPPQSCQWAMLSALIVLGNAAKAQGGNAVVNIKSNFGEVETSSATSYKCGVGNLMVGVALKGEVAIVE